MSLDYTNKAVHSDQIERWLGVDTVRRLSESMIGWYGNPIAVSGVPGNVYVGRDGDFCGKLRAGYSASVVDYAGDLLGRLRRGLRRVSDPRSAALYAGFTSLSDLIAEATAGKKTDFTFHKTGATGVAGVTNSLWGLGNQPAAGANASNAPGGDAPTDATTGAFPFLNPTGGDTLHYVVGWVNGGVSGNNLLLYDRIFQVNKTMNSTATEAVTGAPSRYQSTTQGAADSAENNFLFVEVGGTALAATAHNWTTCLYTDQSGNTSQTLPSLTGSSGAIVRRLDHPAGQFFAPLATGDTGIRALTQMQCSAAVATGVVNFVIGHPIAMMPCALANFSCFNDGIITAFNFTRIFDDAALSFLEVNKPTTAATNYAGIFSAVAG